MGESVWGEILEMLIADSCWKLDPIVDVKFAARPCVHGIVDLSNDKAH